MQNPFSNPILRREYLVMARSRKGFLAAIALIGILSFILFMLWPRTGVLSEFDSNEIFSVFLGANLTLVILLIPAFTSTAITDEREKHAFDLLFTTALSPGDILLGKLLSALGIIFSVVFLSVPVTAVCALSGGISIPLLLKTCGIIGLATFTYGLLGLAVSSLCRRNFTAVTVSYLAIAALAGATWLPSVLLGQLASLHGVWMLLRSLSPFEALFALNHPTSYEIAIGGGVFAATTLWSYTVGMLILAALFLLVFCIFVLRPVRSRKATAQIQYTDVRTQLKRKLIFPFYLIDPLKRKSPIPLWRNPVFVAELRSKIFGRPKFIVRALSTCIAISLGLLILICLNFATMLGPDQVRLVAVVFQFGLIILLAPLVSSGSITDERVSDTILLLRMTPLTAWTVVLGKLKAAFMYVLIFLLSSLPVLFSLAYLETEAAYWRVGAWMITLLLTAIVLILAGLFSSTVMKTTASATALGYGIAFTLTVGTLGVLLFGERISGEIKSVILTANPFVAAVQITSDNLFSTLPPLYGRPLWQNHLIIFSAIAVGLLLITALRVRAIFRERI